MKRSLCRWIAFLLVAAAGKCVLGASESEPPLAMNTQRINHIVLMISSTNELVQREAIKIVMTERQELIRRLAAIASAKQGGGCTDEARAGAAFLLGQMRADESAAALVSVMAHPPFHGVAIEGNNFHPIRNSGVVGGALSCLGLSSAKEAIKRIRMSDDTGEVHELSMVLVGVLHRKAWALDVLKSLIAREENADAKRRLQASYDYLLSCKGDDTDMIIDELRR